MRSRTHKRRSWRAGCRRSLLLASLLASSALLAGCGGTKGEATPKLARADATQLASLARQVARDAANDVFRARFLREARIAARLHHPNLVRVFDITVLDDLPCIVMELVEGPTLDGGRLTLPEAAQVAEGLAHAHASGVVHR